MPLRAILAKASHLPKFVRESSLSKVNSINFELLYKNLSWESSSLIYAYSTDGSVRGTIDFKPRTS